MNRRSLFLSILVAPFLKLFRRPLDFRRSAFTISNTVFWQDSSGILWRTNGYHPERISEYASSGLDWYPAKEIHSMSYER